MWRGGGISGRTHDLEELRINEIILNISLLSWMGGFGLHCLVEGMDS